MTALAATAAGAAAIGLVFFFVNRAVFRSLPAAGPGSFPRVSVVIPARNEERDLAATLRAHAASDYPDLEVIVVDDRSTDGTASIAASFAAGDPRFRVVAGEDPPAGWLGKTHALEEGARAASGAWILFADADVLYAPDALRRAVAEALRRRLAFLALLSRIETRGFGEGVVVANLYDRFYRGPGFLTQIPGVTGLGAGTGSGNLVDASIYRELGGHAALRSAVIDDLELARVFKRAGVRVGAAAAFDLVRVRIYRGFAEAIEGFSKNVAFFGPPGAALVLTILGLELAAAPYVVLAAPAGRDAKLLAAAAIALTIAGKGAVLRETGGRPGLALFHPVTAAVWCAIAVRSWIRRVVFRRVIWRGRAMPAPRGTGGTAPGR